RGGRAPMEARAAAGRIGRLVTVALLLLTACERGARPAAAAEPEPSPPSNAAPATEEGADAEDGTDAEDGSEPGAGTDAARPPLRETVLWVGGDVLLTDMIRDWANAHDDPAEGFARILEPVARHWRADRGAFVLVNLETPVAERRRVPLEGGEVGPGGLAPRRLQGPRWLLPGLARAGVDGVVLANNHALDQEAEGLEETIAAAHRAGLAVAGAGTYPRHRWPLVLGDAGRRLAVVPLYDGRNQRYLDPGDAARSFLDEEGFAQVEAAAEAHDAVVVVVHVLGELRRRPRTRWRGWARRLVEAGADAILVHGTHVPMRVERLEGVPVAWGLGNLVADMARRASPRVRFREALPKIAAADVREGLVARVALGEGGLELRFLGTWMNDDRFVRWRAALPGGDLIEFALLPLSSCEAPAALPAWPAPWRAEVERWVARRRDHLFAVSGLQADRCGAEPTWLRLP
ncbi:MAG TPA: CapA family protein, partial [Polyangiaceae bacterium LLY-WYZ-15_(1-7)]|nr:CapA family protein [Polyangiaceae bacterium LLY-WYZ-15_(1-7)]